MSKLKFGIYWAAACGGCDCSILELHEDILTVVEHVDIVFWPCAMDFKKSDVEAMPDDHMDVVLFHGAIRTTENREMAELLRRKCKTMVAFGACSSMGGVVALSNLSGPGETMKEAYSNTATTSNPDGVMPQTMTEMEPGFEVDLPGILPQVLQLDQVVEVEYTIPGCPPPAPVIKEAVMAIIKGELPPKGHVFGTRKALCDECPKVRTDKAITEIRRYPFDRPRPEQCLLEQGFLCMGPATRGGCGAECPSANFPCTGCMGKTNMADDQGLSMLSALGSIVGGIDEALEDRVLGQIKDLSGVLYKYGMSAGMLPHRTERREV